MTPEELSAHDAAGGGLLVVGSYVGKTSVQLEALLNHCPQLQPVELAVERLLLEDGHAAEIQRCTAAINHHLATGRSVALFTSRRLISACDAEGSLAIGDKVSSGLVSIVAAISTRPRWLIAKGGITSSDIATRALGIRRAMILGQALPGVPVWQMGAESKWPHLAYVVFPGNVGAPDALTTLVRALLDAA